MTKRYKMLQGLKVDTQANVKHFALLVTLKSHFCTGVCCAVQTWKPPGFIRLNTRRYQFPENSPQDIWFKRISKKKAI